MGLFVHYKTAKRFSREAKKRKISNRFRKKLTVKSFLATVCCTESFDIRTARDVYHG